MKAWVFFVLCLVCLSGCSDLGAGSDAGWITYDLPYGHISLPAELAPVRGAGVPPRNPEYVGVVNNQTLTVQFCNYESSWDIQLRDYQEQSTTVQGRRVVLFECIGVFHVYDSHFSTMVGIRAYFRPDGNPVVVLVEIRSPEARDLAVSILMTMRP